MDRVRLVRLEAAPYRELSRLAGTLQVRLGRPVSLSEAAGFALAKAQGKAPPYLKRLKARK